MGYIILLLTLSLLDMQEALTVRLYSERKQVQQHFKQPLENPEGAIQRKWQYNVHKTNKQLEIKRNEISFSCGKRNEHHTTELRSSEHRDT